MVEYLIRVEGHVQGVGYRAFAQRQAVQLGISGHAANRSDGLVEIIAQGDKGSVEAFLNILREGPDPGTVRKLTTIERTPVATHDGFKIR
ncbi:MAG TPA: acylphosphatase [Actinobacteria bacterium]|nr:acylphosphatase [Actinomycetota bacterium]